MGSGGLVITYGDDLECIHLAHHFTTAPYQLRDFHESDRGPPGRRNT